MVMPVQRHINISKQTALLDGFDVGTKASHIIFSCKFNKFNNKLALMLVSVYCITNILTYLTYRVNAKKV